MQEAPIRRRVPGKHKQKQFNSLINFFKKLKSSLKTFIFDINTIYEAARN